MINKLKQFFTTKEQVKANDPAPVAETPKKKTSRKKPKAKSAKELATERGEPYVTVISLDLDPANVGNGSFELDWNDIFVARLVKAGYKGTNDQQIVDQWFQNVCRNIVLETFEQEQADPERRVLGRRRLDSDRTEFS